MKPVRKCAWSSNELRRLHYMIGCWDGNPNNGRKVTCLIRNRHEIRLSSWWHRWNQSASLILCEENTPTGGFPSQRASNVRSSIWTSCMSFSNLNHEDSLLNQSWELFMISKSYFLARLTFAPLEILVTSTKSRGRERRKYAYRLQALMMHYI